MVRCEGCGREEKRHKWVPKDLVETCWLEGIMATICDKRQGMVKLALNRGYNVDGLIESLRMEGKEPCNEKFMLEISS